MAEASRAAVRVAFTELPDNTVRLWVTRRLSASPGSVTRLREFTREEVTGGELNGEIFNLPRVRGTISGGDAGSDGRLWLVETRKDVSGCIVLRYNPVSGQGWLFTASEVSAPIDIAASDTELYVAEGAKVIRFTKPTSVTGDAPLGVLQKTGEFSLSAAPTGLGWFNSKFYAAVGGVISEYNVSGGALVGRVSALPAGAVSGTFSYGGHGLFAVRRTAANPATWWRWNGSEGSWSVVQSGVERSVTCLAATSDRVFVVDRLAGVISPYRVVQPVLLEGFTDYTAPLGLDVEYRVSAQTFSGAVENGDWLG